MIIQKVSLLISLLIATQTTYSITTTVPKKAVVPQKTTTHLISPTLSNDVALMIKKLIREKTPSKNIAKTPAIITKQPTGSIKRVASNAVVAAKSTNKDTKSKK